MEDPHGKLKVENSDKDNTKIPISNIANDPDMSANRADMVVSEHAAYMSDIGLYNLANKKTSIRFFDNGVAMNGAPNTGDIIVWIDSTTTTSGNAVFYLTSNHLSTGIPLFSLISSNSVDTSFIDGSALHAKSAPVISSDLKSVTIPITRQTSTIISVVGINVLGSVSMPSAGNGVVVKLFAVGIAA